jgi:DNA replication protein DnaC
MRTINPKKRSLNEETLVRMNIGRRFWSAEMSDLPESPAKGIFRKYVMDLQENYNQGWGMFLYGANGVGKTHASCAFLKELQRRGYSTYCILADVLKVAYIDGSRFDADNSVVQRVERVDFLLLEDLGKEYSGKGSGFAELCFENLLRKRSRECLPTIVTTNLAPDAFKERYKQSAASLAMECMVACEMKGQDQRVLAGRAKTEEMRS